MKKSLLAVAVAAALPVFAQAQTNVTLYGIADAAVGFADRGASTSNAFRVDSGVQSVSRFGLRGTEDLGGGLKAVFNLEAGYKQDDGTAEASGAGLFQRRAVVGLEGGFGTVLLGRDYTPGFTAGGTTDVMGYGLWGNWLTYTVAGALNGNNWGIQTRASNGIHYVSPAIAGGLRIRAMYSTGERDVAPKSAGNVLGLAATYGAGPLTAQAYYHQFKRAVGTDAVSDKQMGLGAGYNFGMFRIAGSYNVADPDGANNKHTGYNLGVGVKLGAGELLGQVIQQKVSTGGTDPKATTFGIAYTQPLSKRTNVYATYGQTRNNSTGAFVLRASDITIAPVVAGDDPKAFSVGLRHMF